MENLEHCARNVLPKQWETTAGFWGGKLLKLTCVSEKKLWEWGEGFGIEEFRGREWCVIALLWGTLNSNLRSPMLFKNHCIRIKTVLFKWEMLSSDHILIHTMHCFIALTHSINLINAHLNAFSVLQNKWNSVVWCFFSQTFLLSKRMLSSQGSCACAPS